MEDIPPPSGANSGTARQLSRESSQAHLERGAKEVSYNPLWFPGCRDEPKPGLYSPASRILSSSIRIPLAYFGRLFRRFACSCSGSSSCLGGRRLGRSSAVHRGTVRPLAVTLGKRTPIRQLKTSQSSQGRRYQTKLSEENTAHLVMPVYGPFPGDIFKLRLANMRSHKPANLSRSGVK